MKSKPIGNIYSQCIYSHTISTILLFYNPCSTFCFFFLIYCGWFMNFIQLIDIKYSMLVIFI